MGDPLRALTAGQGLAILFSLVASIAHAQWPPSGLPLATGPNNQVFPEGIAYGDGSLHAFWVDAGPAPFAIYSQRVTPSGGFAPGWPTGGRGAVTSSARPNELEVSSDGQGGALLAWYDYRTVPTETRGIYGARVNSEGSVMPGWSQHGRPVCVVLNAEGLGPLPQLMQVCTDGNGGGFYAWTDARNTPPMQPLVYNVFGQHVLSNGALDPAWPAGGRELVGGAGYHYPQALLPDNAGGFWLVSEDDAGGLAVTQHATNGDPLGRWTTAFTSSQPAAASDGAGGIFVAWRDFRTQASAPDIYAIRLGPGAAPSAGWPITGVPVASTPDPENVPAITESNGAAIVAWLDDASGATFYAARRFEPNGVPTPGWAAAGRQFSHGPLLVGRPLIAPDGAGGAMFAFRRNTPNLFGSRIDAAGMIPTAFPDTGLSLCSVSGNQFLDGLVFDNFVGAYVLWADLRDNATDRSNIFATRFTRDGAVGPTVDTTAPPLPPHLALSGPAPNPMRGSCSFWLSLPAAGHARVQVFDLSGRLVATLLDASLPPGPHMLRWDGHDGSGKRAPAGVYVVQGSAGGASVTRRIARLE